MDATLQPNATVSKRLCGCPVCRQLTRLTCGSVTPVCQGSIISYQGPSDSQPRLYVTSPYSDAGRFTGTVLASDDDGLTFSRSLQLWPGKPHQPGMGGGFGYTGLACGLPGKDFDCAVLFDQDEPGLWLLTFNSSHVKTDDPEAGL